MWCCLQVRFTGRTRTDNRVARFGPTTPTRARRLADASVDPIEARNATVRRALGAGFVAAFERVRAWTDAYKATETRFVAQNPRFDDPIYSEDLPNGTPLFPDYADIRLLLDRFRLGDLHTIDKSLITAYRDLGVFD
jgi:hypothetical protein